MTHEVRIPFLPEFRAPLLAGVKTQTARTRRAAHAGDTFKAFGGVFVVTNVFQAPLGKVAEEHFVMEGVASPQAFRAVWGRVHPTKGFDAEQVVWVIRFRRDGSHEVPPTA